MSDELTIRVRHIRAARLCLRGAREWFARRELSWTDFLTDGLPASFVRGLDDPFGNQVVAAAEREAN